MENKRLTFEEKHDEHYRVNQDVFTFSVAGGAEEYLQTIQALLRVLGDVSNEHCDQDDRYYICTLIRDMLPSIDQMMMIQEQTTTDKP